MLCFLFVMKIIVIIIMKIVVVVVMIQNTEWIIFVQKIKQQYVNNLSPTFRLFKGNFSIYIYEYWKHNLYHVK